MTNKALIESMLEFLRDACADWARIASDAEASGDQALARKAREQHRKCEEEMARLKTALAKES